MFARSAKWLLVAALVFSLGFHWAVLQSVAWVSMTISYSQNASLRAALSKTFDGKHPCKLCRLVRDGKKAEQKSETKFETQKLDSFVVSSGSFVFEPQPAASTPHFARFKSRIAVPLAPPPRAA